MIFSNFAAGKLRRQSFRDSRFLPAWFFEPTKLQLPIIMNLQVPLSL